MASDSMKGGLVALGLLGLALYSCGSSSKPASSTTSYAVRDSDGEVERDAFDEDAARERAEEELASDTYTGAGASYGCTDDCSGHEAGWRFRAERGYQGVNGDSPSFEEGGQAFDDAVEEKVEEERDAYEAGEDGG